MSFALNSFKVTLASSDMILDTFTPFYLREYSKALVQKTREEFDAYRLLDKPLLAAVGNIDRVPICQGTLAKESRDQKKWKERWVVVWSDFTVEYYKNEVSFRNKSLPPRILAPAGYKCINPEEAALSTLRATSALCGGLVNSVHALPSHSYEQIGLPDQQPGVRTFPPFTFALARRRRRTWFLRCPDEGSMYRWTKVRACCSSGR